ncbi:protein translocase subunit SecD [Candidatus Tachikawaea gelatinosa]|uniref:Protein translocase subunit SecD n=1 Tax=Candidatus Tachikawaea gelatinosa TaxID=1410383 RepID=A0A090BWK2_9ENTR|nr:protein translocase subunit SecD [Candidatus Tachikawaea gelatinosa]BAP58751.1 protein translocase subunit SecD [Candidatus Tachikawaea gelatinosa]
MSNRYPFWKYCLFIIIIIIGSLYALPNIYGESPAIQITLTHYKPFTKNTLNQIHNVLKKEKISAQKLILDNKSFFIFFKNTETQLNFYNILKKKLGKNYLVALNLYPSTPKWMQKIGAHPMKLGLDLRGGIYFLMQSDVDKNFINIQNNNIKLIKKTINLNKIHYKKIEKISNKKIKIYLYDEKDSKKLLKNLQLLNKNFFISVFKKNIYVQMKDEFVHKTIIEITKKNIGILRNRLNQLGLSEILIYQQGFDKIVVEIPGIQDATHAKEIISLTAMIELHVVETDILKYSQDYEKTLEVKSTRDGQKYLLKKNVILSGNHIINSNVSIDEYNKPQVDIMLDDQGGNLMFNFSKKNIGKLIATLLIEYYETGKKDIHGDKVLQKKEEIINIAKIQSVLNNNFRISGIKNIDEARQLSLLLRSGALIAPLRILEERIIGPIMGKKNITQGIKSCIWSVIAASCFMIIFYKKFGLIAVFSLFINLILITGLMSLIPNITLTMPGIAGIVLTIAIAVDANVLINERIKEELINNNSIQLSIFYGYKNALSSILDANFSTLITTIVLYIFGTGAIKGFAITTAIGIFTSMFSSIFITRGIVNLLYGHKNIKKLSI